MKKKYLCYDILWDVDDEDDLDELSTKMEVTINDSDGIDTDNEEELTEFLSEKITNYTGFCHDGFLYKQLN